MQQMSKWMQQEDAASEQVDGVKWSFDRIWKKNASQIMIEKEGRKISNLLHEIQTVDLVNPKPWMNINSLRLIAQWSNVSRSILLDFINQFPYFYFMHDFTVSCSEAENKRTAESIFRDTYFGTLCNDKRWRLNRNVEWRN